MTRHLTLLGIILTIGLGCGSSPQRNLVLISLDTLVPGRMSAYGNERQTTTAIDAMLGDSVRFTNAFSPSPWTLPAHAAMLTGRYPSSLAPDPNDRRLYLLAPLLSTRFNWKGYRTGAVTGGLFVSRAFGADRGFEFFEKGDVDLAIEWVRTNGSQPFFLFFHTYAIHVDYEDRRFVGDMDGGRLQDIYRPSLDGLRLYAKVCCEGFDPTPEERRFLLALYDGGIAAADEMVGRLVAALDEIGVLNRTTIVITSDHGEEFWEHTGRAAYHGHTLYDELLRVPLIWYEPGLTSAGDSRAQPVSLIDLVPTVAARFGLDVRESLDGVDLSPLLDGETWSVERSLFGEGVRHGPTRRSARNDRGKLIVSAGKQRGEGERYPVPVRAPHELYLAEDVLEERNRFGERAELARALRDILEQRERASHPTEPSVEPPRLDAETREQLRELGYIEP